MLEPDQISPMVLRTVTVPQSFLTVVRESRPTKQKDAHLRGWRPGDQRLDPGGGLGPLLPATPPARGRGSEISKFDQFHFYYKTL